MKYRVTKKRMKENCLDIIAVGYCDAQTLLYYHDPEAYSCGAYGWSCDYYKLWYTTPDGYKRCVYISTGYSPIGKRADYNITHEYEEQAKKILYNSKLGDVRPLTESLLNDWLNAITGGDEK